MRISYQHPKIEPTELYLLLKKHDLLPALSTEALVPVVRAMSDNAVFTIVTEDDSSDPGVLATTMTTRMNSATLGFVWIPEVKKLHTRRNELIDLGEEFRQQWFTQGVRRVEARVPLLRSQTIRSLKAMGFRQETLDCGLREAVDYGHGPEGLAVLGLLATDLPRVKREEAANGS